MYTHFARPMDEKFTNLQFDRFLEVVKMLKKEGQNPGMLHCSESTAILKYPMMHLNAVRLRFDFARKNDDKSRRFAKSGTSENQYSRNKNSSKRV